MMTALNPIGFSDNFWESVEKNGVTILTDRMRGAKQTCERFKHAYEARALLEEEYGKTLLQIAQKQKASSTENGSSKFAMDTMQAQFQSVAESHVQLSNLLRENIAVPLSKLLNKQRALRKELQTSMQKLYSNRQLQVHFVRRAHKRHNMEIEKANLLVQQQTSEKDKRAVFKTAEMTIDKLKKVYDEALNDLTKIVDDWNIEWKQTCESFEKLEQERLEFFRSNLTNCAHLMVGCLEGEIQAYEKIGLEANNVDVTQDLVEFVKKNKSSDIVPSPLEYIKLHAYHEANQDGGELKQNAIRDTNDNEDHQEPEDRVQVHISRKRSSTVSSVLSDNDVVTKPMERAVSDHVPLQVVTKQAIAEPIKPADDEQPILMMGIMEVYASDEESDEEEYEYVTETESEGEEEEEVEEVVVVKKMEAEDEAIEIKPQTVQEPIVTEEVKNEEVQEKEPAQEVKKIEQIQPPTEESVVPQRRPVESPIQKERPRSAIYQDAKVDRLTSAYQEQMEKRRYSAMQPQQQMPPSLLASKSNTTFNPKRRVSFVDSSPIIPEPEQAVIINSRVQQIESAKPSTTLDRFNTPYTYNNTHQIEKDKEDFSRDSEDAALELDDMLRELDSKRITRNNGEESYRNQFDIKPTVSISSPSLLQKQQQRRNNIPNSYFPNQSRRMSTAESASYSRQSSSGTISSSGSSLMDLYDPFNSLSSKETHGNSSTSSNLNTGSSRQRDAGFTPPSAQMIHGRMLQNSGSSASSGSLRSTEQPASCRTDKFIQDFYTVGSKMPSADNTVKKPATGPFIDFAFALYDYDEVDEAEISFKEGDLLGIISKGDEGDVQGWWEASLLNRRNQKVIRTGIVPSNFLETASK